MKTVCINTVAEHERACEGLKVFLELLSHSQLLTIPFLTLQDTHRLTYFLTTPNYQIKFCYRGIICLYSCKILNVHNLLTKKVPNTE